MVIMSFKNGYKHLMAQKNNLFMSFASGTLLKSQIINMVQQNKNKIKLKKKGVV